MNDLKHVDPSPKEFWEDLYATQKTGSSGNPGALFVQYTKDLTPGRALDVGCAHGDDALWLAGRGWHVTGADISQTVIDRAQQNAKAAGLSERTKFERHDLTQTSPAGQFDLVTAFYVHSQNDFLGTQILRRAATSVAPGGLLLIVAHASVAPWSWADPDTKYPTAEEALAELALDDGWTPEYVGSPERTATGPGGQVAVVLDTILAVRRGGA